MHAWTRGEKVLCDFEKISQTALALKNVFASRVLVCHSASHSQKKLLLYAFFALDMGQDAINFETYLRI
jgi:hypothetical protein